MDIVVFYIPLFLYCLIILSFTVGWIKIKARSLDKSVLNTKVSILIAIRNEEHNIDSLVSCLINQNYPKDILEIIFIDDHSDDNSLQRLKEYESKYDLIKVQVLTDKIFGKKAALQKGFQTVTGSLIITTDADCQMNPNWIQSIVEYYEIYNPKMIIAPVLFSAHESFFNKIQSLEFLSLIGSTAGSTGIKHPIMCNGANLAFSKSVINSSQNNGNKYISGDDIFLMLSIKKDQKDDIHFLKSKDAVATTSPCGTIKKFIQQRIRWTSKSKGYKDPAIIITALIVAITNIVWLSTIALSFFEYKYIKIAFGYFLIKSIVDLALLVPVSAFFKLSRLLLIFPIVQIIYPFYIFFIAIAGNFMKFKWKGRVLKK